MNLISKYKNKANVSNEGIFDTIKALFKKNPNIQKEVAKKRKFDPTKIKESLEEQLNELKSIVKSNTVKPRKLKAGNYDTLFIGKGNNGEDVAYKLLDKTVKDIPKFLAYAKFVEQLQTTAAKRLDELTKLVRNGKSINHLDLFFPSQDDIKLLKSYFINKPYITVGKRKTLSSDAYIGFNRGVILFDEYDGGR